MSTLVFIKSIAIASIVLIYSILNYIVHNQTVLNNLFKSDRNFKINCKSIPTSGDPKRELEKGVLDSNLNSASY